MTIITNKINFGKRKIEASPHTHHFKMLRVPVDFEWLKLLADMADFVFIHGTLLLRKATRLKPGIFFFKKQKNDLSNFRY